MYCVYNSLKVCEENSNHGRYGYMTPALASLEWVIITVRTASPIGSLDSSTLDQGAQNLSLTTLKVNCNLLNRRTVGCAL